MTTIAILPEGQGSPPRYRAVAGESQTVGEALDALTAQLDEEERGTLMVVQSFRPDRFFTATQRQRLEELWGRRHAARAAGAPLAAEEQAELEALVEAEVRASAGRSCPLLHTILGKE